MIWKEPEKGKSGKAASARKAKNARSREGESRHENRSSAPGRSTNSPTPERSTNSPALGSSTVSPASRQFTRLVVGLSQPKMEPVEGRTDAASAGSVVDRSISGEISATHLDDKSA